MLELNELRGVLRNSHAMGCDRKTPIIVPAEQSGLSHA